MVSRMGDFGRTEKNMRNDLKLKEVIDHALLFCRGKIEKNNVKVEINLEDDNLACWGDQISLEQVFMNLFSNACDAMEQSKLKKICVDAKKMDDSILIKISDSGEGMSKKVQREIFESFFTTKGAGKGTGLGLASCKQIIDDHQGTIKLESLVGVGTAFSINLKKRNNDSAL